MNFRRKAHKAGKEQEQIAVELILSLGGDDDGLHVKAVTVEIDAIEAAIGGI